MKRAALLLVIVLMLAVGTTICWGQGGGAEGTLRYDADYWAGSLTYPGLSTGGGASIIRPKVKLKYTDKPYVAPPWTVNKGM